MNTNVDLNPTSTGGVGGKKNPNKELQVASTSKNTGAKGVGGMSNPNSMSVFDVESKGNGTYKPSNSRSIDSMINSKLEM